MEPTLARASRSLWAAASSLAAPLSRQGYLHSGVPQQQPVQQPINRAFSSLSASSSGRGSEQSRALGFGFRAGATDQPPAGARGMCKWLADSSATTAGIPLGQQALHADRGPDVGLHSQVVFDSCWRRFEERNTLQNVYVPREVVWLNGAPGSGKGVNSQHIVATRGLDQVICMSSLLQNHPDSRDIIKRGDLIPDTVVGDLLLEALLINSCQRPECGVLVDGFPRTALQVDFLKLLYDKCMELHGIWATTPHEAQFPRPLFKVVMLYVDEDMSVARQMARAKLAADHNKKVMDAMAGELWEQRATDLSVEHCKKRYAIFKKHYTATMRLKSFFPFHLIDAMGSLEETREAITLELRYQSSLDLSEATYQSLRHLPLSRDLAMHARQRLVTRLDDHCEKLPHLFQRVIDFITAEIMPGLRASGLGGRYAYTTDMRMFNDHPQAVQMLMDVLTDRGFNVSHSIQVQHVPVQFDLTTGVIKNRKDVQHRFDVRWDSQNVREFAKALEIAQHIEQPTQAASGNTARISTSFIPETPPRMPIRLNGNGSGQRQLGFATSQQKMADGDCAAAAQEVVIHGS